jgi:predicted transcriptional regulator of viral defense system
VKYGTLLELARTHPLLETSALVAMGEDPASVAVQLTRWVSAGKLLKLRRGLYLLPEALRSREVPLPEIANYLVRPSYVSLQYALGHYGLIPETVHLVQSVTTRRPARFATPLGELSFHCVQERWFFGYEEVEVPGGRAFVARPEKALLDLFHLEPGEWTRARLAELRLQNHELLDTGALLAMAERVESPRMLRAARRTAALLTEDRDSWEVQP